MSRKLIEHIVESVREIPNRIEPLGGQNYKYVRLEEVIGLLLDALDSYEAKPLPEPIGYIKRFENGWIQFVTEAKGKEYVPIYEEQPTTVSKPLKYHEIYRGAKENKASMHSFLLGVRFAEEKHGIKGKK
jgi:hypothetical protein